MAHAYFGEFTDTFGMLGVEAGFYSMSRVYAEGRLDGTIDAFLRASPKVREIYRRRGGAQRPADWLPFQPVCERCGRIGTTYATDYDGETVAYRCSADVVQWASGCGARGRISPFGGNGKLPWKLEWAAKWKLFGVSIEGAGKDHMAASGSHEVSGDLARQVLGSNVPVAVPYEFFTLGGAKMSSSKGIGITASELARLLPPELLRYLVLRTQPPPGHRLRPRRAPRSPRPSSSSNGSGGLLRPLSQAPTSASCSRSRVRTRVLRFPRRRRSARRSIRC